MVRIRFLGTCSGTEPQPNRHHTSFTIEHNDQIFFFDAGEGCGYNAHLLGVDLLKTTAIFISHPHMDHIGGLPHLLWTIKKLESRGRKPLKHDIDLLVPTMDIWHGVDKMMFLKGRALKSGIEFKAQQIANGVIYNLHGLKVSAMHNTHLGTPEDGLPWMSFSFLIELAGKRIVYSGDFKKMSELAGFLDNVDLLIVENGHHSIESILEYLVKEQCSVKRVGFMHHGRAVLRDPKAALVKAKELWGHEVFIANDSMIEYL